MMPGVMGAPVCNAAGATSDGWDWSDDRQLGGTDPICLAAGNGALDLLSSCDLS